ncbi:alpha/beta fold hydrolase [Ramlibacter sp. PS3R-8]|uniref:PHA/PHB synthase family protein n=1 Tax=Ramlibacter sp. PS3R-8 TaxID=3133437 RepID=UPI0030B66F27
MNTQVASHEPHSQALDLPLKTALARTAHGISPASVAMAHADWLTHLLVSPSRQSELASSALQKSLLWLRFASQAWAGPCAPCAEPMPGDKRFARSDWQLPFFATLAQGFLLTEQWWDEATRGVRGVSRHHEEVASFTVRQWLDMLSPSNFAALNPEVIRGTLASGGANLATGLANFWRDAIAVAAGGPPRGVEAFRPGEGVALTPGKVVHRNHLMELIQYEPATERAQKEPLLIVPSWIMKYYILDLTPDDSLVRYLVSQGHTVFMISWRNPGADDRNLGLDDYVETGVLQALAEVRRIRPGTQVHAAGYCLGGTLLAVAAALLGKRRDPVLRTVTLLAAQVDFEEPGELGLFMDESQVALLEDLMAERGYLDGREMAGAFQLINSKDLVWSKLVHEYLMGARTPMTPMRAWNADATRLPARMHSEYLRRLYLENHLAENTYAVHGETVSLRDIRVPLFVVATERDHVSPWRSVYKVLPLVSAPSDFVLVSGGHNVGIVSPADGPLAFAEAAYRHASHARHEAPLDAQDWLGSAPAAARGSWWTCWSQWLGRHSSGTVPAKPVTKVRLSGKVVPAPGAYVLVP